MNANCHKKMRQNWKQVDEEKMIAKDIVEYSYVKRDMALSNWKLM